MTAEAPVQHSLTKLVRTPINPTDSTQDFVLTHVFKYCAKLDYQQIDVRNVYIIYSWISKMCLCVKRFPD